MVEVLVWILIASGGSNSGSSIMQPIFFKTQEQCQHVANFVSDKYIFNRARCIQANILVSR